MKQPHEYKRRILLCVIGMTPQIVTETLYKLIVDTDPSFKPTEIHIISTGEGAQSAQNGLLGVDNEEGAFHRFCHDYSVHGIEFTPENIHIISEPGGVFVNDTECHDHNRVTADFITAKIWQFTSDENCAIHLSLAGGRKTMSYYAGYALSLYGRMQDRLSHVLVAKTFQENENFFYPPPRPKSFPVDNVFYSTDDANIMLSDIPFVRMRYQIPHALLEGKAGFQETVDIIQRFSRPEAIEINIEQKALYLNGMEIKLENVDLAVYLWMCERAINNELPFVPDDDAFVEEYITVYAKIVGEYSGYINRAEKVAMEKNAQEQKEWFQMRKSKLNAAINKVLGAKQAFPFLIQTIEFEGKIGYGIVIEKRAISIR